MAVDVTGVLDDTIYQVRIDGDGAHGNTRVGRLLTMHDGREVEVDGHGVFTVDDTPEGMFACLMAHTRVIAVDGDVPGAFRDVAA